ncbi:peripheral-type benzodiazepine receptor-associated protein 1-like isoform X13 [Mytilus californianus]|uniref:peripheral-type benzodiazepine receptor-associated protein 1-like isoform X13 n=1 Tax=Mytilus californianus TaxID=6549 RepID=UPI002246AB32|nr:peripheral-type benzodiazepine receptor-associated protein 1-like isoform X13 [Mytilus californianus]
MTEMELGRRYSGGRFTLKDDDFEFDFNDISRASTPMSIKSAKSEGRRRERSSHSIEDYKRKIARLKSELEMEKARNKQVHKEKTSEIKTIQSKLEKEKEDQIHHLEDKLIQEKRREVEILQDSIIKSKDRELKQVLRYKEDEVSSLKAKVEKDIQTAVKMSKEEEKSRYEETLREMAAENQRLKDERGKLEEKLRKKAVEENKKEKEFTEIKDGYDAELRKILDESRKLAIVNLQKLKKAEKALSEGGFAEDDSVCSTPFSDILSHHSRRAPSRTLAQKLEEIRVDELELEKYLASANPSPAFSLSNPSPALSLRNPSPGFSLNKTYSMDSAFSLPSKSPAMFSSSGGDEESQKENRKLSEDKDRHLQKRVSELQTQVQRLERKISLLNNENESIKKRQDEKKPLEEKIKTLKKRNAELAAIARRLEEKAKHLQQENIKKVKEDGHGHPETDHLKKMFARQRAKDLSEHAKAMLAKDREIEDLRKKCQELADQLSNAEFLGPENVQMYEEKEELISIIKQAAKERLTMEKQIAKIKPNVQADTKRLKELESVNEALQNEVVKLSKAKEETERLEIEFTQKKIECERLNKEIERERARSRNLEADLQESATQNTELTIQVSDLTHRLADLEKVSEECNLLRLNLTEAQRECEQAKNERNRLQKQVKELEDTVKNLKDTAEQFTQLEHDHQKTVQKLQEKQTHYDQLQQAHDQTKKDYEDALSKLQGRVSNLQDQCQKQEERHRVLTEELEQLRAATKSVKNSPRNKSHNTSSSTTHNKSDSFSSSAYDSQKHTENNDTNIIESSKSLDTGFADDDEVELSNGLSPDQGKVNQSDLANQSDLNEDPELNEIAKKLKELEASSDSEEEVISQEVISEEVIVPIEDKGEDSGMESNFDRKSKDDFMAEDRTAMLEKKGPITVYIAKYTYDPYQHSPNDNPDAELALSSGDYVLVYGDMDEDGFFEAELMDGRRGLVPSNFIEKLSDDDLSEFHAIMSGNNPQEHDDDSTAANSLQQELDFDSSEETDTKSAKNSKSKSPVLEDLSVQKSEISSHIDSTVDDTVIPFPKHLVLERQLGSSVVITWQPPDGVAPQDVRVYHVCLDGKVIITVKGNERTKSLIENVDCNQVHRVSVRCLSSKGLSLDNQATLLIGKGLEAGTEHTVTITARNPLGEKTKGHQSAFVEFKTLKGGMPEPPINVQVEAGPREGSLLLTWLPVTLEPSGFSNGALVKGYVVYADGQRTKEAKGATNDHMILNASDFRGFIPRNLVVRTVNTDNQESADSEVVKLPHSLISEITDSAAKELVSKDKSKKTPSASKERQPSIDQEIQKAVEVVTENEVAMSPSNVYEADFIESSSNSELSDIPEVEEDSIEEANGSSIQDEQSSSLVFPNHDTPVQDLNEDDSSTPRSTSTPRAIHKPSQPSSTAPPTIKVDLATKDRSRASPKMKIPAIEITRDSSSERGNSLDVSEDETDLDISSKGNSPSKKQHESPKATKQSPRVKSDIDHVDSESTSNMDSKFGDENIRKSEDKNRQPSDHSQTNGYQSLDSSFDSSRTITSKNNSPRSISNTPRKQPSNGTQSGHDANANKVIRENSPVRTVKRDDIPPLDLNGCDDRSDVDSISGEINPPIDDNRVRLFVALFDYDPESMSPNTDALDEELPFKEGQIIKIFGDKDADGFYRGESNGRVGYVPCNMVSEVQVDDDELADQLLKESQGTTFNINAQLIGNDHFIKPVKSSDELSTSPSSMLPVYDSDNMRRMVALYDYDPQELSPNVDAEVELSFKVGDIIMVYGEMDDDGFFMGEHNGRRGLVPSNFLQEAPLTDDEAMESASVVSPARSGESLATLSRQSDTQTQRVGSHATVEPLPQDRLDNSNQKTDSRSTTPDEVKQKRKGSSFLSKGKNIFKKLTR